MASPRITRSATVTATSDALSTAQATCDHVAATTAAAAATTTMSPPEHLQCPICQELFFAAVTLIPCGHSVCSMCIRQHIHASLTKRITNKHAECAICRTVLPSESSWRPNMRLQMEVFHHQQMHANDGTSLLLVQRSRVEAPPTIPKVAFRYLKKHQLFDLCRKVGLPASTEEQCQKQYTKYALYLQANKDEKVQTKTAAELRKLVLETGGNAINNNRHTIISNGTRRTNSWRTAFTQQDWKALLSDAVQRWEKQMASSPYWLVLHLHCKTASQRSHIFRLLRRARHGSQSVCSLPIRDLMNAYDAKDPGKIYAKPDTAASVPAAVAVNNPYRSSSHSTAVSKPSFVNTVVPVTIETTAATTPSRPQPRVASQSSPLPTNPYHSTSYRAPGLPKAASISGKHYPFVASPSKVQSNMYLNSNANTTQRNPILQSSYQSNAVVPFVSMPSSNTIPSTSSINHSSYARSTAPWNVQASFNTPQTPAQPNLAKPVSPSAHNVASKMPAAFQQSTRIKPLETFFPQKAASTSTLYYDVDLSNPTTSSSSTAVHHSSPSSSSRPTKKMKPSFGWSCPICTYTHQHVRPECVMCGTPNAATSTTSIY